MSPETLYTLAAGFFLLWTVACIWIGIQLGRDPQSPRDPKWGGSE